MLLLLSCGAHVSQFRTSEAEAWLQTILSAWRGSQCSITHHKAHTSHVKALVRGQKRPDSKINAAELVQSVFFWFEVCVWGFCRRVCCRSSRICCIEAFGSTPRVIPPADHFAAGAATHLAMCHRRLSVVLRRFLRRAATQYETRNMQYSTHEIPHTHTRTQVTTRTVTTSFSSFSGVGISGFRARTLSEDLHSARSKSEGNRVDCHALIMLGSSFGSVGAKTSSKKYLPSLV